MQYLVESPGWTRWRMTPSEPSHWGRPQRSIMILAASSMISGVIEPPLQSIMVPPTCRSRPSKKLSATDFALPVLNAHGGAARARVLGEADALATEDGAVLGADDGEVVRSPLVVVPAWAEGLDIEGEAGEDLAVPAKSRDLALQAIDLCLVLHLGQHQTSTMAMAPPKAAAALVRSWNPS